MKKETKDNIYEILSSCVNRTIGRIRSQYTYRPFHRALLSKEIVVASSFERSFSTSLGQGPIEEISKILAESNGYQAERQKVTMINVYKGAIDEIERIMSALRAGETTPNWKYELQKITAHQKGNTEVRRITSDLWLKNETKEVFISIKTVKPNLDQTEIAKRDMLFLNAHNPNFDTYFGLFYNPGGERKEDYNWTIPFKIFNMLTDPCVLIGQEYWDFLGGENTYTQVIDIFEKVGKQTRNQLKDFINSVP